MATVPERIKRLQQRPWIAHIIRAVERYVNRLGSQFAAATSYFSVLAMVPIMMMAFSITGFVLTVVQPELRRRRRRRCRESARQYGRRDPREDPRSREQRAQLSIWAIGIVGLVVGLYTGAKWMGHLEKCGAHPMATRIRP